MQDMKTLSGVPGFSKREPSLDILRGLAIFIMIGANMAAYLLKEPHPYAFRFYGSLAAPLFIFIFGMMVPLAARLKVCGFPHFLKRGLFILACGALIDFLVWGLMPFVGWDVLYLIGVSIPLVFLASRIPAPFRWMLALASALVLPGVFQSVFGYHAVPEEYPLREGLKSFSLGTAFRQWALDGWFPFFPWFGIALAGANFESLRSRYSGSKVFLQKTAGAGLVLAAAGAFAWYFFPGDSYTRGGYSELFYPAFPGFVLAALGLTLLLFAAVSSLQALRLLKPFALLGKHSLFVYVFHTLLIAWVLVSTIPAQGMGLFLAIYAAVVTFIFGVVLLRERIGSRKS